VIIENKKCLGQFKKMETKEFFKINKKNQEKMPFILKKIKKNLKL